MSDEKDTTDDTTPGPGHGPGGTLGGGNLGGGNLGDGAVDGIGDDGAADDGLATAMNGPEG